MKHSPIFLIFTLLIVAVIFYGCVNGIPTAYKNLENMPTGSAYRPDSDVVEVSPDSVPAEDISALPASFAPESFSPEPISSSRYSFTYSVPTYSQVSTSTSSLSSTVSSPSSGTPSVPLTSDIGTKITPSSNTLETYVEFISRCRLVEESFEYADLTEDQMAVASIYLSQDSLKVDSYDESYVARYTFEKNITNYFGRDAFDPTKLTTASSIEFRGNRYYILDRPIFPYTYKIDSVYDLGNGYLRLDTTVSTPSVDSGGNPLRVKNAAAVFILLKTSASTYSFNLIAQKYGLFS